MEPSLSDSRASVLFPPRGVGAAEEVEARVGKGMKAEFKVTLRQP
jgi:hypothetical protein